VKLVLTMVDDSYSNPDPIQRELAHSNPEGVANDPIQREAAQNNPEGVVNEIVEEFSKSCGN